MPHFQQTEPASKSASRLGRFAKSVSEEEKKKKKNGDMVKNVQEFAKKEAERKKKEEEEKKKKKAAPVDTAPQKGFLQRMYERMVGPSASK